MKLQNKVVLVTGASTGIGAATALAFAKEGCSVVINYRTDATAARAVLQQCNAFSEKNMAIRADITNEEAVRKMMKAIHQRYGSLQVLVNNVGIFDSRDNPTNIAVFERLFQTNFLGHVRIVKHTLPFMRRGKIINISSIHGRLGHSRPGAIAYSAMKAALESYTLTLAKALAPRILVNAIAPGRVATAQWGNPNKNQQKVYGQAHLIKRMIQPEEIADAVLFLARNDAMCGHVLTVDGGMGLKMLG